MTAKSKLLRKGWNPTDLNPNAIDSEFREITSKTKQNDVLWIPQDEYLL
ncbi:hypothetical protein [Helicobacter bilis]|nr:hypothetical protein [Helicobacter bilis]